MSSDNATQPAVPVCHIVTPVGMLGYGFDEQELDAALHEFAKSAAPTAIILDSGSTDSGPRKLAKGDMTSPHSSYLRDLRKLLRRVKEFGVPLLVSSVGGDGSNEHLEVMEGIVKEVTAESPGDLKVVSIPAGIDKDLVRQRLKAGEVSGCGASVPALLEKDIDEATQIVAQMGPEPYWVAMEKTPDYNVILGGRSNDPAPYVAFATAAFRKFSPDYERDQSFAEKVDGSIHHMGKIMECGGICAKPKSRGAAATVFSDGSFEMVPTGQESQCTPVSVASHTLYENGRPDILAGPGGWLDLNGSIYEQKEDGRTVRVHGGIFKKSVDNGKPYEVKLEAARNKGFRYMYMGAIRDPILLGQLDHLLVRVKQYVRSQQDDSNQDTWELEFHVYGRDSPEIFLIGEVVAQTADLARSIASTARTATIHGTYPGQKATGGNFAFGLGGLGEIDCGSCPEFCIYHLMTLKPGEEVELFPTTCRTFPGGGEETTKDESAIPKPKPPTTSQQNRFQDAANAEKSADLPLKTATILSDVATVLRSKNAGPFEITLDVMFDREEIFEAVKDSNLLSAEVIAKLYGLRVDEVIWCGWYKQALAFKATIPRKRGDQSISNGGFMESDMHGAQKHVPLFSVPLPDALRKQLAALA